MYRASTPTHYFRLPYAPEEIKEIWLIYSQNGVNLLRKTMGELSYSDGVWSIRLTQEETNKFSDVYSSHAEGCSSHAEGYSSHAEGDYSHAEGYFSHAVGRSQHVQGEYNIVDPQYDSNQPGERGKYAHIVGNGTSEDHRSNAHTLDWEGNAWFAGTVEGTALILKSPGGKRFQITVDDNGNLSATAV